MPGVGMTLYGMPLDDFDIGDYITLVLGLAALILSLVTIFSQAGPRSSPGAQTTRRWKVTGGITALVATAALVVPFATAGNNDAGLVGTATSIAATSPNITIDGTDDGSIPLCATIKGSAPVVQHRDLWIAYRRDTPNNRTHLFIRTIKGEGTERWQTPPSEVGRKSSTGHRYRFYAFYASKDFSSFLAGAAAGITDDLTPAQPYPYFIALPQGVEDSPIRTFTRNADSRPCD